VVSFHQVSPPACAECPTLLTLLHSITRMIYDEQHRPRSSSVYQYTETNLMHFLFILLRVKGLYMFQALLAHLQEALHKQHLVYWMLVTSVGCNRIGVEHSSTPILVQPSVKCHLCNISWGWASNAQNM
jgi:hypothetical protein